MFEPKLPANGTTIFTVMSALANEYNAVNLSQGFPDFDIDEPLANAVAQAVKEGFNQYAPMAGLPALRAAIVHKIAHYQKTAVNPDTEITITPGATYAIYTALTAILQKGDEVIVPEPAYDSYLPNIKLNGGVPVTVSLGEDFKMDWQRIAAAVTPRTKVIIINNPHNPLGTVYDESDMQQLTALATKHNLIVIADEVYEHLIYDGRKHISVLSIPELRERSFVVHSFGKVFNTTGWKIGYCIAPPAWTQHFRMIHQFLAFSVNTPAQKGLADYLSDLNNIEATRSMLETKRNYFLKAMTDTRFTYMQPAQGSFFQVMDYSAISSLPDNKFAQWLTKEHGVATIPVSAFYAKGNNHTLVRFCFAKKESTLDEAVRRLAAI